MGRYGGLSYETPGYQDSRNDSKMGNVFSASFLKVFSGSEDELAKKVCFCQKGQKFFLTWTLPLGRVGPTAALLENEMCFFLWSITFVF